MCIRDSLKGIIHQSTALLADSGYLLLGHGYTQQAAVTREMALAGYESTAYSDLADNPRAVMGYRKEAS